MIVGFQAAIIVISNLTYEHDRELIDLEMNFYNRRGFDSIIDVVLKLRLRVLEAKIYVKLSTQADPNDNDFKTERVRTVVDIKKLLAGINANFLFKGAMEDLLKKADFPLKFPLGPV